MSNVIITGNLNVLGGGQIADCPIITVIESGDNYIRYSDNTQICYGRLITATTGGNTVTFPKPFLEIPSVCGTFEGGASTTNYYSYIIKGSLTSTGFQIKGFKNEYCDYIAIGKWR